MKSPFSFLFTLILLAFVSCKKETLPLGENFIPVNKCQSYNKGGNTLTICLDSVITDSRCPINATCIWQGMAAARFSVIEQNNDHIISLATLKFAPYNRDTTLAGYTIELIGLSPQPDLNKPLKYNDYVAEVKITKL